jgi:hypothetical protein
LFCVPSISANIYKDNGGPWGRVNRKIKTDKRNREYIILNSVVVSDEEPQDLDGERHEDFVGHILG